jgi:hypothetical protein
MGIEGHIRTTIYLRDDLYTKMRELNFNVSEFVNRCLDMVLSGENTDITNLMNEKRALSARLAEIEQKLTVVRNTTTAPKEQLTPPIDKREETLKRNREWAEKHGLKFEMGESDGT